MIKQYTHFIAVNLWLAAAIIILAFGAEGKFLALLACLIPAGINVHFFLKAKYENSD